MITRRRTNNAHLDGPPVALRSPSIRGLFSQTAGVGRCAADRPAPLSSTIHAGDLGDIDEPATDQAPGAKVAFVFAGGGSLAAGEVGMVRALNEAGIDADLVVGSSAGALNGVAFAAGPRSDLDALERLWTSLRRRHVAPLSARLLVQALSGHADALFSNAALRAVIDEHLPSRLQDTRIPAHVVATDFHSGRPVVISHGQTASALLASSAFPGLYPPVTIAGQTLIDGGIAADIPVLQAEQLGATVTYVLPAALSGGLDTPLHGPMAMAYRALGQILDAAALRDTAAARGQVHILPAPISAASNPLDFRESPRLIAEGYKLATCWLATRADRAGIASDAS